MQQKQEAGRRYAKTAAASPAQNGRLQGLTRCIALPPIQQGQPRRLAAGLLLLHLQLLLGRQQNLVRLHTAHSSHQL